MVYNRGMPKWRFRRAASQLVLVTLVVTCLGSSVPPVYMKNLPFFPSLKLAFSGNSIGFYENRFHPVVAWINSENVLGYVDRGFSDIDYRDGPRIEPYYLAQYAMAPIALENNALTHRYVLGNFADNFEYRSIALQNDLSVWHDFGNGVVLFKHESG